jgi:aldose 1-epimerase
MEANVKRYGVTSDGEAFLVTLQAGDIEANITNYGCIIQSIKAPDRNGEKIDVVLGFDKLEDYIRYGAHFGCVVGRYANRISNARFILNGIEYRLSANNGRNSLHGGARGFDKMLWKIDRVDSSKVSFSYLSSDGEEGYPGKLDVSVEYSLTSNGELAVIYGAITDKATVINLTNHSYFNLAGSGDILDHVVLINADYYTPADAELIPTGEICAVAGTPMDLRKPMLIRDRILEPFDQLKYGGGFDVNYALNRASDMIIPAASVYHPASGRFMEVYSTEPGIQFYTGNQLKGKYIGKSGIAYEKNAGLCVETQHFPDSPNHPTFPNTILRPGETYTQCTKYRFTVR